MRALRLALALTISPTLVGCALVFGISGGQYDPDPFGVRDGSSGTIDSAASDSAGPPIDSGTLNDAVAGDTAGEASRSDAAPIDADAGPPPCGLLLDDLESGDGNIVRCAGRNGSWYTANDGLPGTQVPAPTDRFLPVQPGYNSKYCAHTSGNGFTSGGAQMGFSFATGSTGARVQYDLSAYTGITFWSKSATAFTMYVNFPDRNTDPAGGVCKPGGIVCNDTYGKGMAVGTSWSQVTVPFSILSTDGAGAPGGFDKAHVYAIEFHAAPTEMPFEFWVDEVALYK
jgi:hypothetical protein